MSLSMSSDSPRTPEETPIAWSEGPVGGTLTVTKGGSVLEVVVDENGKRIIENQSF